jgi:hypothetical protein
MLSSAHVELQFVSAAWIIVVDCVQRTVAAQMKWFQADVECLSSASGAWLLFSSHHVTVA